MCFLIQLSVLTSFLPKRFRLMLFMLLQVTDACVNVRQIKKDAEVAAKSEYPLVLVEVFYETLCPDSKDFIIDQVSFV